MSKDHEVLDYVLDVTPDTDRHGRLRHVVALDRGGIVTGKQIGRAHV